MLLLIESLNQGQRSNSSNKGSFRKFNVTGKRKLVAKEGRGGVWKLIFSTNGQFPFRGGGLQKMVTSFLFPATLNFLNGP